MKAVSPRIAVLSVIRVPECLQAGSDEVKSVNHNLETDEPQYSCCTCCWCTSPWTSSS